MFRILILALLLSSCCVCPPQDAYFMTVDTEGNPHGIVKLDKDYFKNEDLWFTQDEMEEIYRKQKEKKEKEQTKSF